MIAWEPERPEIECRQCDGQGCVLPEKRMGSTDCPACDGQGWRPATDEEWNDLSADAWSDLCESEPPVSLSEQHQMAAEQKRSLS